VPNDEEQIDRLYRLPLGEFTPSRDALVRALREAGSREDAEAVKRLRKPSLIAWALNRVRHEHRDRVEALLRAGQRLQEAQRQLVTGGERGRLREAAAAERSAVEDVVDLAEAQLAQAGRPANATAQSKLFATVHAAAAGSAEAAELLRAGRLVRDYEISDLGLPAGGTVAPSSRKRDQAGAERSRAAAEAERERKALAAQLERARARASELERRAQEAQARADEAKANAVEAAARVAELTAALRDAGGRP
jgi:hypothetical protein